MKKINFGFVIVLMGVLMASAVVASRTEGVIDANHRYVWGENIGWVDFGSTEGIVQITDSALSGYAWAENVGWVSLSCKNDNSCATVDFGVVNDGNGVLSGKAYGENIGWVDFAPAGGGVTIDGDGVFGGTAWGENVGWLVFGCKETNSCDTVNYSLVTDWRGEVAREALDVYDVAHKTTDTTITIKWKTSQKADSKVRFGTNKELSKDKKDKKQRKKHKIKLKNLSPDTKYYFRIKSASDNEEDRSRIYAVKTDKSTIVNAWLSSPWQEASEEVGYEKLSAEVDNQNQTKVSEERAQQIDEYFAKEAGVDSVEEYKQKIKQVSGDKVGLITRAGRSVSGAWEGFATGVQSKLSGVGKAIARFTATKQTKLRKQLFATRVFEKEGVAHIAQMRFQVFDKKGLPLAGVETTLFSKPQTAITDDNGIATFRDVPVGTHTLAFAHNDQQFRKSVAIAKPKTVDGIVQTEVVQVYAGTQIAWWVWIVIAAMLVFFATTVYIGTKYYKLKKLQKT